MTSARVCAAACFAVAWCAQPAEALGANGTLLANETLLGGAILAPWESYLAPYADDLVSYRRSPQGRRFIALSHLVSAVPTFITDLFIPLLLRDSSLTIPINEPIELRDSWLAIPINETGPLRDSSLTLPLNKTVPLSIPPGMVGIPLPASLTIVGATIKDLNRFKDLRPLSFVDESQYSWRGDLAMSKVGVDLLVRLQLFGKPFDVTVSVELQDLQLHFLLIAAWRRTAMCETWGALLRSSMSCAVWPMFVDSAARVAGFKFETLQASISGFSYDVHIAGVGGFASKALTQHLAEMIGAAKQQLVAGAPTRSSEVLKGVLNSLFLDGVDAMHKAKPCHVGEWGRQVDRYLDVSRVCITNSGLFAMSFGSHDCPRHAHAEAPSWPFPTDVTKCVDIKDLFPGAVEGETLRATVHAIGGLHEILDPAVRYVPGSNVASWECGSGMQGFLWYSCKLMSVMPANTAVLPEASRVCVINHAGFALRFMERNLRTQVASHSSRAYTINNVDCIDLKDIQGAQVGDRIATEVKAIAGARKATDTAVIYKDNGLTVTFECKGATFWYACKGLRGPPTLV